MSSILNQSSSVRFYNQVVSVIDVCTNDKISLEGLEKICIPLFEELNPQFVTKNLLNTFIKNRSNDNWGYYYPIAHLILDKYPHFYIDKPKELADFAWELASSLGHNDGGDELFEKILPLVVNEINYDPLKDLTNAPNKNASIAWQLFYNKNSKEKFIPILLDVGANFTQSQLKYPSVLEQYFQDIQEYIENDSLELNSDDVAIIEILSSHPKTKNTFHHLLDEFPLVRDSEVSSILLNMKLKIEIPMKSSKSSKKI